MENNTCVYMHLNPITHEVFYIGEGTKHRRDRDWKIRKNKSWHEIVEVYGKPIIHSVVEGVSKDVALKIETCLIIKYGRLIDSTGSLTNIRVNEKLSQETKDKMSKANLGKKLSQETRDKIGIANKGPQKKKRRGSLSKYKYVNWNTQSSKWTASIPINGKQVFLGRWENEEDANYIAQLGLKMKHLYTGSPKEFKKLLIFF